MNISVSISMAGPAVPTNLKGKKNKFSDMRPTGMHDGEGIPLIVCMSCTSLLKDGFASAYYRAACIAETTYSLKTRVFK